jgi:hypothetical protein
LGSRPPPASEFQIYEISIIGVTVRPFSERSGATSCPVRLGRSAGRRGQARRTRTRLEPDPDPGRAAITIATSVSPVPSRVSR